MIYILRRLLALTVIIMLHGMISGIGLIAYAQGPLWLASLIWLINIPALRMSQMIYRGVTRMGIIDFITMNSSTAELDVPRPKRKDLLDL